MSPSHVEIAVVVLTLDQRAKTLRCLASFTAVRAPTFGIWVFDNGSTDGTVEAIAGAFPEVRIHRHPTNLGVASGRNRAAEAAMAEARPDFLLFLDNDTTVTPDFLIRLVAPFAEDPRLALTTPKLRDLQRPQRLYGAGGCRIRFWRGDTRHAHYGEVDRGQYDRRAACIPSGGCVLVRSDVFCSLGGFDTVFDPYGPEDLDFGLRARRAGYSALYVPEAVVFHESRPGRTFESGVYTRRYASNRARHWLLLLHRHASIGQRVAFFLLGAPILLANLAIREGKKGNLVGAVGGLLRGAASTLGRPAL